MFKISIHKSDYDTKYFCCYIQTTASIMKISKNLCLINNINDEFKTLSQTVKNHDINF